MNSLFYKFVTEQLKGLRCKQASLYSEVVLELCFGLSALRKGWKKSSEKTQEPNKNKNFIWVESTYQNMYTHNSYL